jgi:hypothetical protein
MSIAPPPPRKTKGEPPAAQDTLKTLPAAAGCERDTPLNFRLAKSFKRDFKIAAAQRGISQVELLERLFQKVGEV